MEFLGKRLDSVYFSIRFLYPRALQRHIHIHIHQEGPEVI